MMTLKQFCEQLGSVKDADKLSIFKFSSRIGGVEFTLDNITFNGTMANERGVYGISLDLSNLEETFKDEDDEDFY